MDNFEDFFERPAVRNSLALFGICLAVMGLVIMTHAKDVGMNEFICHASKVIELIPNWPWKNSAGELLLPGMDHNSRGLRIVCEHGGIYIESSRSRWPWTNETGGWKWPWK